MEFLHKQIESEYQRWLDMCGPDDPYTSRVSVGLHEVLRAHFLIADFFVETDRGIGGLGPRSLDLLHSAIYRQFVAFGGKEKWEDSYHKLATLMFGLVKDHPFHDANKRTALLVTLYQLDRLNRTPRVSQKEFEDFVVDVADNRLARFARFRSISEKEEDAEVRFIADFLRRSTREIETRQYTITYHQLNQRLGDFGFGLSNPSKNGIDVVRVEYKPRILGVIGPRVRKEFRVACVGFPGWKKQVPRGILKKVREATRLTPTWGYDSAVFYQGADPLHALIDIYSEPLTRLANR